MKKRTIINKSRKTQGAIAFSEDQMGCTLYAKLKDEPCYATICTACVNIGMLQALKMEREVPAEGDFSPVSCGMDNRMGPWKYIHVIWLRVKAGYRDASHRMLFLEIPFADGTGRNISGLLASGTKAEVLEYLRSPAFGPKLMAALDDFNETLRNHD